MAVYMDACVQRVLYYARPSRKFTFKIIDKNYSLFSFDLVPPLTSGVIQDVLYIKSWAKNIVGQLC